MLGRGRMVTKPQPVYDEDRYGTYYPGERETAWMN